MAVIPARYYSSRLPGKPLIDLGGKPMIQWVLERVSRASLPSSVLVATDDHRIQDVVQSLGFKVVMTPSDLPSGTDRVALAVKNLHADIIINIQGDEPFIQPDAVDQVATLLIKDNQADMGTLVNRIADVDELEDPNTVKVVIDEHSNALYFSRSPIPFYRDRNEKFQWLK